MEEKRRTGASSCDGGCLGDGPAAAPGSGAGGADGERERVEGRDEIAFH